MGLVFKVWGLGSGVWGLGSWVPGLQNLGPRQVVAANVARGVLSKLMMIIPTCTPFCAPTGSQRGDDLAFGHERLGGVECSGVDWSCLSLASNWLLVAIAIAVAVVFVLLHALLLCACAQLAI